MSHLDEQIELLVKLRQEYRLLHDEISDLEDDIVANMETRSYQSTVGLVTKRGKNDRSKWDHDGLFSAVRHIAHEMPKLPTEDGEVEDDIDFGISMVKACMRPNWRKTDLEKLGIDADEYCHKEFAGFSIDIEEGIMA